MYGILGAIMGIMVSVFVVGGLLMILPEMPRAANAIVAAIGFLLCITLCSWAMIKLRKRITGTLAEDMISRPYPDEQTTAKFPRSFRIWGYFQAVLGFILILLFFVYHDSEFGGVLAILYGSAFLISGIMMAWIGTHLATKDMSKAIRFHQSVLYIIIAVTLVTAFVNYNPKSLVGYVLLPIFLIRLLIADKRALGYRSEK